VAYQTDPQCSDDQGGVYEIAKDGLLPPRKLVADTDAEDTRDVEYDDSGTRIAFARRGAGTDGYDILAVNRDGTGLGPVVGGPGDQTGPSYSVNGILAYESSGHVIVAGRDLGTGHQPDLLRDGSRVAFSASPAELSAGSETNRRLWVMNADGTDRYQILPDCTFELNVCSEHTNPDYQYPDWSYDDAWIGFQDTFSGLAASACTARLERSLQAVRVPMTEHPAALPPSGTSATGSTMRVRRRSLRSTFHLRHLRRSSEATPSCLRRTRLSSGTTTWRPTAPTTPRRSPRTT
jgi:hypothetical protein